MDSLYIKAKGIYYVRAKGCTQAGQMDLVSVKAKGIYSLSGEKGFILCQGKRDSDSDSHRIYFIPYIYIIALVVL